MAKSTPEAEVAMERRNEESDRRASDRRSEQDNADYGGEERRQGERRKVQRRRQIDPTTCERDYSQDEIEFMQALDAYKRRSGRMFPTCSEILEVVRELGYVKLADEEFEPDALEPLEGTSEAYDDESEGDEDFLDDDA